MTIMNGRGEPMKMPTMHKTVALQKAVRDVITPAVAFKPVLAQSVIILSATPELVNGKEVLRLNICAQMKIKAALALLTGAIEALEKEQSLPPNEDPPLPTAA